MLIQITQRPNNILIERKINYTRKSKMATVTTLARNILNTPCQAKLTICTISEYLFWTCFTRRVKNTWDKLYFFWGKLIMHEHQRWLPLQSLKVIYYRSTCNSHHHTYTISVPIFDVFFMLILNFLEAKS